MSCKFSQIVNFITIKNIIYQGDPHVHSLTYFTLKANVHGKPKYNQKVTLVSQKSEQGVISHNSPMPPSPLQQFIRLTKLTVLPNYLLLKNFYLPSPSTILIFVSIVLVMALHARLNILLNTLLLLVSEVAQSCPTLCDPMDCSPPGSSIHGILQARILEWGAISFSNFR